MRERRLLKWASMAPPFGKLADIRFIKSMKQEYVVTSAIVKSNRKCIFQFISNHSYVKGTHHRQK